MSKSQSILQHNLNDVLTIASLKTIVQVERKSRGRDNARVRRATEQLRAIMHRAACLDFTAAA